MSKGSNLKKLQDAANIAKAENATKEAQAMLEKSSKILQAVINRSKHFNWDEHKNTSVFTMQRPKVGLLDRLFKKNRAKGKQNKGMGNKTSYISI